MRRVLPHAGIGMLLLCLCIPRLKYVSTQAEHSSAPTEFLVRQDGWYRTYQVSYHGGPQYPHLVRIAGKPDMLAKIMAAHAGS